MNVVTPQQMAEIDRHTMDKQGLPPLVLMENAARSCLPYVPMGKRVVVLVGPGNNGGDGLVLARALLEQGRKVNCLILSENLSEECQIQQELARNWGVELHEAMEEFKIEESRPLLEGADIIIDALFGTGLSRDLEGHYRAAVSAANACGAHRFAIDIPSGIDGRHGQILGAAFHADTTVTFGCYKLAHFLFPGRAHCGRLYLTQPGFHPDALEMYDRIQLCTQEWAGRFLPKPWPTIHKGDNGKLLLVTGSAQYPGAGTLSVLGALKAGAGLVTHSCARENSASVLNWAPECIPLHRPQLPEPDHFDAGVVGCGLGPDAEEIGVEVLKKARFPLVVDADAIPHIKQIPPQLLPRAIITPHPGELARLLKTSVEILEKRRVSIALEAAAELGCVVCLKGAPTVTAAPDGRAFINSTGHTCLAQGGSGDLLAGIIGAYLGYGLPSLEAAAAGAYIHGLAAQLAAKQIGERGVTAHRVADLVPIAYTDTVGKH